jgi:hypothetical protein
MDRIRSLIAGLGKARPRGAVTAAFRDDRLLQPPVHATTCPIANMQ